jgi:hypothetical protein
MNAREPITLSSADSSKAIRSATMYLYFGRFDDCLGQIAACGVKPTYSDTPIDDITSATRRLWEEYGKVHTKELANLSVLLLTEVFTERLMQKFAESPQIPHYEAWLMYTVTMGKRHSVKATYDVLKAHYDMRLQDVYSRLRYDVKIVVSEDEYYDISNMQMIESAYRETVEHAGRIMP